MKIKTIVIFCLCMVYSGLFAQIKFEKQIISTFSGSTGNYVVQTSDEGYLGLGDFLFRTDKNGDTLWTKKILDKGYCIAPVGNDEFLLSGEIGGVCSVVKIDIRGNLLWKKKYELEKKSAWYKQGIHIMNTTDNQNLVISGSYIIKINSIGDSLWTFKDFDQQFRSIKEIDGFYYAKSPRGVYKLSSSGKIIWVKNYGDAATEKYYGEGDIVQLPGGHILLLYSSYPDDGELVFIKINSEGDTIWTKSTKEYIKNNDPLLNFSVAVSKDGLFVLSSNSEVTQYDFNGNMLWKKSFTIKSLSNDLKVTKDGGLVLFGTSTDSKLLLIKIAPELLGNQMPSTAIETSNFYPNPFSDYTTMALNDTYAHLELTLISSIGKAQKTLYNKPANNIVIERENLQKGIYIYELTDGTSVLSRGKISIEW